MYVEITKMRIKLKDQSYVDINTPGAMTVAHASCEKVPQILTSANVSPSRYTRRDINGFLKRGDTIAHINCCDYYLDRIIGTSLVDISDDGISMRLVCPAGVIDGEVNLSSESIYAYNEVDNSVVGVWESDEGDSWYVERYGLQDNGTFASIDGGLYDFGRDDDGNIVEGYRSALEAYFEVARRDGDMFCGPDVFELAFNAYCAAAPVIKARPELAVFKELDHPIKVADNNRNKICW